MTRNRLYVLLSIACLAGYAWLFINYHNPDGDVSVCMFKRFTSIPCPSCGSTRSILSLVHGHFLEAFTWNPVGIVLFLIMAVTPPWLVYDLLTGKDTLYKFYLQAEQTLRHKWVAIPAVALVLINWGWNIYKGL